jgi:hypothetical protein
MDWRYEYALQDPSGLWALPGALIYVALAAVWLWGLLAGARGSRPGWIASLISALVLNVLLALATYFFFCPPWTGCEAWPNAWLWNWTNLLAGLLAVIATAIQLGQRQVAA